jgi:hypothetical protein
MFSFSVVEVNSLNVISVRVTPLLTSESLTILDSLKFILSCSSSPGLVYLVPIRLNIMSSTTLLTTLSLFNPFGSLYLK